MLRTYISFLVIIIICCEWSMVIKWRKNMQTYKCTELYNNQKRPAFINRSTKGVYKSRIFHMITAVL